MPKAILAIDDRKEGGNLQELMEVENRHWRSKKGSNQGRNEEGREHKMNYGIEDSAK